MGFCLNPARGACACGVSRAYDVYESIGQILWPRTSGTHFLSRLKKFSGKPDFRFAVLGFGDRQFPKFCQFAVDVDTALHAKGWARLCPLDLIDRQSSQEFARWDLNIGEVMGASLSLNYQPECPHTLRLRLAERLAYGTRSAAGTYLGDSPPRWRCRTQRALPGQITNSFTAIEQCDTLISIELNHVKLESSYVCPD